MRFVQDRCQVGVMAPERVTERLLSDARAGDEAAFRG